MNHHLARLAILLVLPLVSGGCTVAFSMAEAAGFESRAVEPEWKPLERIWERPTFLASETVTTTIGRNVYVADLNDWSARHPTGSPLYRATMRLEQEHARRQLDRGVLAWVAQYSYDRDFMWAEEQIGWYWGLMTLRKLGQQISLKAVATNLKGYRNLAGRMIGYEDALTWVKEVLAGRWLPPAE